jgi:hypothetical protein
MNTLTLVGLSLAISTAYASDLNPGGTVGPIQVYSYGPSEFPSGNSNNGVVGANTSQGGGWSAVSNLAGANINYADAVYTDPTTGDLDFFYQIEPSILGNPIDTNSSELSTVINGCTLTEFTITGVEQITSATFTPFGNFVVPTSSTNGISSVSLSSNDQDLTIDYSTNVDPGQYSAILVIETNGTPCVPNGGSANGGSDISGSANSGAAGPPADSSGSQSGSSGEPVVAPEPSVYGTLSLGCTGLLLLAHRRQRKAKMKASTTSL